MSIGKSKEEKCGRIYSADDASNSLVAGVEMSLFFKIGLGCQVQHGAAQGNSKLCVVI